MSDKIDNNRQKRGRPTKAKQSKNRKKCLEAYENYYSAGHTANILDLNRHTVEKYFKEFQEAEIEETNYDFILRQRSAKNRVLTKLDGILEKLYGQLDDIENVITDDKHGETHDIGKYEYMRTQILSKLSDILQQKASIEITPTLDITIDKYLEERYGQLIKKEV
tara:strand:+ start:1933 stop:2427 length:495 start_codon:yes stop_codon:yes gene_type:complete